MGEFLIKMPDIGEGIAEAELVEWHVAEGDEIAVDQAIADVMTDKATVQIPSPVAGTVLRLGAPVGESVAVGAELVRLTVEGRGNVSASTPPGSPPVTPAPDDAVVPDVTAVPSADDPEVASPQPAAEQSPPHPADEPTLVEPVSSPAGSASPGRPKALASPAVRARAKDAGIDLADVAATGQHGQVSHADLDRFLAGNRAGGYGAGSKRTEVEEIPIVGLRRAISNRMQASAQNIPHITIVDEVDVTALEELRLKLNRRGDQPRLTVLPFLMQAVVRAVSEQPSFNAHFDDEAGVLRQYAAVHLGIATQGPDGLKVPVVRHAEALDLRGAAAELARLSDAARDGTATREELSGSTITITSLGPLGALVTTPIINRPEVAIVGVNKMQVRPVWNGTGFGPRTMMNLSSSFDHRIIDGWDAAVFVARLKELLENPALLFL